MLLILFVGWVTTQACRQLERRASEDSADYPAGIEQALVRGADQFLQKAVVGPRGDGTYVVATTQIVAPAGESVVFAGRPTDLALSPDEALLAVKSSFHLVFIDVASRQVVQALELPATSGEFPDLGEGSASYCGLAWSRDGQQIWMTDAHDTLHRASLTDDGTFAWTENIYLPGPAVEERSAPGGLALDEDEGIVYVALSRNNSIGVVDLETKRVVGEIPVGIAPFTILLHGSKAYVTNWGGRRPESSDVTGPSSGSRVVVDPETGIASTGSVTVVDLETATPVREIPVDLHPSGMVLSPDGSKLFVANANSDTVSIIDTVAEEVSGTLGVKPMPELPYGSAPNALAISGDGAIIYVANGGNNAVAVVDVVSGKASGFIPTGWYPGAVAISRSADLLMVANVNGFGSRGVDQTITLPLKPDRVAGYNSHDYVGSVSIIPIPNETLLAQHTEQVAINMRLPEMSRAMALEPGRSQTVPVPTRPGEVHRMVWIMSMAGARWRLPSAPTRDAGLSIATITIKTVCSAPWSSSWGCHP